MNCVNCREPLGENCVEGGFCSEECRAASEHEEKLRQNEHVSILVRTLDDGATTVQLNLREPNSVQEMTQRFDNMGAALRGIAVLCTSIADGLESEGDE